MGYVRKVFGIVSVQLLVTFACCLFASYNESFGDFCKQLWVQLMSLFGVIFTLLALFCIPRLRKEVPVNFIILFVFTGFESLAVSGLTAWLTPESVLISIGVLCIAVTSLCSAALVTPLSAKLVAFLLIGLLVGILLQLMIVMTMCIYGYLNTYMYMLYATLGCAISGLLIFIDVIKIQILGKVAVDEYVLGAVLLYIDIIRLLIYILMIFGKSK